jgi:hypothetical protein
MIALRIVGKICADFLRTPQRISDIEDSLAEREEA